MKTYPKLFIYSALLYLAVATAFGLAIVLDPMNAATHRFLHIHFLFLGFMISLVAGLAYELLPRMRTGSMRWPRLIPVHFWVANLALCGKAASYLLREEIGLVPFVVCACCVIATLGMFAVNVAWTLRQADRQPDGVGQPPLELRASQRPGDMNRGSEDAEVVLHDLIGPTISTQG
jgi:hypothetical protein